MSHSRARDVLGAVVVLLAAVAFLISYAPMARVMIGLVAP
jgi:hypothetical protein